MQPHATRTAAGVLEGQPCHADNDGASIAHGGRRRAVRRGMGDARPLRARADADGRVDGATEHNDAVAQEWLLHRVGKEAREELDAVAGLAEARAAVDEAIEAGLSTNSRMSQYLICLSRVRATSRILRAGSSACARPR